MSLAQGQDAMALLVVTSFTSHESLKTSTPSIKV